MENGGIDDGIDSPIRFLPVVAVKKAVGMSRCACTSLTATRRTRTSQEDKAPTYQIAVYGYCRHLLPDLQYLFRSCEESQDVRVLSLYFTARLTKLQTSWTSPCQGSDSISRGLQANVYTNLSPASLPYN